MDLVEESSAAWRSGVGEEKISFAFIARGSFARAYLGGGNLKSAEKH